LQRYLSPSGERIYQFDPFLSDISSYAPDLKTGTLSSTRTIDPSEIDTIVVPAREEGFQETFIGENCWYQIRIHGSMIPQIKHIAVYRVAPISAITHIAPVKSIEQWKDTNKFILHFSEPAKKIRPVKLIPKGRIKALQNLRYTSLKKIKSAKTLEDAF
jgi:hypothetical protein